jgi:hypothetical protein
MTTNEGISPANDYQKLLPPATLSEEDEFYARCNRAGLSFVDRVNGKPLWVYHYSIDRPDCNWHSPPVIEDEDEYGDEDDEPTSEEVQRDNKKGWISQLLALWK